MVNLSDKTIYCNWIFDMKYVYKNVNHLDKKAYDCYLLSEDILMEHAALGIKKEIDCLGGIKKVFIACGPGNNGADGITLARLLLSDGYDVKIFLPLGVKSTMAKLQFKRTTSLGVDVVEKIEESDVLVDALFGSGLNKKLDKQSEKIIEELNRRQAVKVACDVPSGLFSDGSYEKVFLADITVSMGALKLAFYFDKTKDICGKVVNANLGLPYEKYRAETDYFLLEKSDMNLPVRNMHNVHKGNYGHVAVIEGCMPGAPAMTAMAALEFGAGLVTVVGYENHNYPFALMHSTHIPQNANVLAVGMGLGKGYEEDEIFKMCKNRSLVIDADLFSKNIIKEILQLNQSTVLTPHPKEFAMLLNTLERRDISAQNIIDDKYSYAIEFSKKYKDIVLVLKGVNTLIAYNEKIYISSMGTPALAKGGSGDVLAGMIAALLAQNYDPKDAAITAVLAHSIAALSLQGRNYSLTPSKLIDAIGKI